MTYIIAMMRPPDICHDISHKQTDLELYVSTIDCLIVQHHVLHTNVQRPYLLLARLSVFLDGRGCRVLLASIGQALEVLHIHFVGSQSGSAMTYQPMMHR